MFGHYKKTPKITKLSFKKNKVIPLYALYLITVQTLAPEAAQYETCYVTAHKGECRIAAWSKDGEFW